MYDLMDTTLVPRYYWDLTEGTTSDMVFRPPYTLYVGCFWLGSNCKGYIDYVYTISYVSIWVKKASMKCAPTSEFS